MRGSGNDHSCEEVVVRGYPRIEAVLSEDLHGRAGLLLAGFDEDVAAGGQPAAALGSHPAQ